MKPAIRIDALGKKYRVTQGAPRGGYRTLRESLVDVAAAPFRRLRSAREGADQAADFWALQDVSFDVQPGDVVGIIGRNGAGKSTLLKILSRITKPTTGRVEINGRVGSLLEVGTGFHPELTGRENVYLNGSILGMSHREIDRKFDEIVAFAEVDRFLETPVKRYSSGMYVRLAFAVAAHLEPEILIVDEVLAVGDAAFQKKCLGRMKTIGSEGRTVLFVSHNMSAVLGLCRSAMRIDAGRVADIGETNTVVEAFTRTLGSSSQGFVDLTNHPSRQHGCQPLLKGIQFVDKEGIETSCFACGERVRIIFDFDPPPGGMERPEFGIGFDDCYGQRVFSVATYLSCGELAPIRERTNVCCDLAELPLAPGQYTLSLSAGTFGNTLIDALHSAVTVEVVAGDYYGNGRLPVSGLGQVLMKSNWSRL